MSSAGGGGGGGGDGGPNWLGLLQWSLAHQDGTAPTNAEMMTQDNQAWLESALREGVKDEPKRMGQVIVAVKQHLDSDELSSEDVEMMEEVVDITDQIDMAGVFVKLGGFKLIMDLVIGFGSSDARPSLTEGVMAAALALAGNVSQNNPVVQREALAEAETGGSLLDAVALLVRSGPGQGSQAVQTKGLLALSCFVRGDCAAEGVFVARHGQDLFAALVSQHEGSIGDIWANTIIGRLMFMSRALLSSEYVTLQTLSLISTTVLSICPKGIQESDVNFRDSSIGLITEYLRTVEGRASLSAHVSALLLALETVEGVLNARAAEATCEDDRTYIAEDLLIVGNLTKQLSDLGNGAAMVGIGRIVALPDNDTTGEIMMLGAPP
jgi:hypothetical protein